MTLRVLVVDDEPLARRKLVRFLEAEPGTLVVGECGDGAEALRRIEELAPDLVFLDIQMPGVSGLEVAEAIGPEAIPALVFVTAFDQYAVKAFEIHALDYLLKPFDRDRFRRALERARAERAGGADGALRRQLADVLAELRRRTGPAPRFLVRERGGVAIVRAADVDWIEAQGNYVCLHVGPEAHLLRETMAGIEGRLDPSAFLRIRRTAIVNVARIEALRPWTKDEKVVVLGTGARLAVSRRYRERAERLLGGLL